MAESDRMERSFVSTRDGARLALYRCAGPASAWPPVLLTHGTFSNRAICVRLAAYLRDAGFDTWLFEWRGHGASEAGSVEADYERFATHDLEAALAAVLERARQPALFFVGHSAGGVLPWMHLARTPAAAARFRGVVSLASQTTHAGRPSAMKLGLALASVLVDAFGRAPAALFRLGPEDESRAMMNQWLRWNRSGQWIGAGGFDYLAALATLRVPALCLCGGGDRFIAPEAGCRRLFDALGSHDKTFLRCGLAEQFREDYGHARLIASRNATDEVWPRLAHWLRERSRADAQAPVMAAA